MMIEVPTGTTLRIELADIISKCGDRPVGLLYVCGELNKKYFFKRARYTQEEYRSTISSIAKNKEIMKIINEGIKWLVFNNLIEITETHPTDIVEGIDFEQPFFRARQELSVLLG